MGLPPCVCALCQLQSNSSADGFPGLGIKARWLCGWPASAALPRPGIACRAARLHLITAAHGPLGRAQELREIAKALSEGGRPAEAEEAYRSILHLSADDAEALHGLGLARVHQGRWTAGYRAWRRGAARAPASEELREVVLKERVYAAAYPPGGARWLVVSRARQSLIMRFATQTEAEANMNDRWPRRSRAPDAVCLSTVLRQSSQGRLQPRQPRLHRAGAR